MNDLRIIETDRLLLRPFLMTDLPEVYGRASDPEVVKYNGEILNYRETELLLKKRIAAQEHDWPLGTRAVVLKSTGRNIGYCGLNRLTHIDGEPIELCYGLTRAFWGCGFATEAAEAMLQHSFATLGLTEIAAAIHPLNTSSIRVARRLGMKFQGKIEWPRQGRVNLYGISKQRWERQKQLTAEAGPRLRLGIRAPHFAHNRCSPDESGFKPLEETRSEMGHFRALA